MRLLDTVTAKFVEKDPSDWTTKYAILSHAWDTKGEQTYQEVRGIQERYTAKSWPHPQSHPQSPDDTSRLNWFLFAMQSQTPDRRTSVPSPSRPTYISSSILPIVPESDPPPHIPPAEAPLGPILDDPELSPKIRMACAVARANGYRYIWIDSCCIDKTSSSELSESINSMYQWYSCAEVCYAFLADVKADEDPKEEDSTFRGSRWFTRGWTLQELIAPAHVEFLAMDWTSIGSKRGLGALVSKITNVHYTVLQRLEPLNEFSVAQRLSWASGRRTTRVEDRAYSLLGIFGINMPTLYGEGEGAFRRLQEEIMRRVPDQSLFAWSRDCMSSLTLLVERASSGLAFLPHRRQSTVRTLLGHDTCLIAPSLDLFNGCGRIEAVSHDEVARQLQCDPSIVTCYYDFTPHGIRTQLPAIPLSLYLCADTMDDGLLSGWYLVVLGCEHNDLPGRLLGRVCHIPASTESSVQFLYCGYIEVPQYREASDPRPPFNHHFSLLPLFPADFASLPSRQTYIKTVHIPYPGRVDKPRVVAFRKPHERICLVLPKKTRRDLYTQGYTATLEGANEDHPTAQWLTLAHSDKSHTIIIEYQYTLDKDGVELSIEAHVRTAGPGGLREPDQELAGTVSWIDSYPWAQTLDKQVVVATVGPKTFRIVLDLRLATPDHYIPSIKISNGTSTVTPSPGWRQPRNADQRRLVHMSLEKSWGRERKDDVAKVQAEMQGAVDRTKCKDELSSPVVTNGETLGWWAL